MSTAALGVAALVAAGAWFALGGAPLPHRPVRARGASGGTDVTHDRRCSGVSPSWGLAGRGSRARDVDVAAVLTEVSSRLRAGEPVERAWRRTIERRGLAGVLRVSDGSGEAGRGPVNGFAADARGMTDSTLGIGLEASPSGAALEAQVGAARAAVRLAERVGAPLADVLDRCAEGIVEAGQAEAARRVALAGPASTARLLAWLPLGGLVLGGMLGADPLETLLDGGLGTLSALAGLALLFTGRRWSHALVEAARRPEVAVGDGYRGRRSRGRRRGGRRRGGWGSPGRAEERPGRRGGRRR